MMVLYTFDDGLLNDFLNDVFFDIDVFLFNCFFTLYNDNVRTIDHFGISLSKILKLWEFAFHHFQSLW